MKKKLNQKDSNKSDIKVSKKLQDVFNQFPKILKTKAKAAKERLRIEKNFLSAKKDLFR